MKNILLSITVLIVFMSTIIKPSLSQSVDKNMVIGEYKTMYSEILSENRQLIISLPEEYNDSKQTYPVLYLIDGEKKFVFAEAVGAKDYLRFNPDFKEMIIVGINTEHHRNRDLIPAIVEDRKGSGGAKKFTEFIEKELKPYINKKYRTNGFEVLYGGSNGGLFAIYTLLEKPALFDAYIASSPMIGHCPDFMYKKLSNTMHITNKKIYVNYGKHDLERATDFIPDFIEAMKKKKWKNFEIRYDYLEDEGHVPFGSIYSGLKHVFL